MILMRTSPQGWGGRAIGTQVLDAERRIFVTGGPVTIDRFRALCEGSSVLIRVDDGFAHSHSHLPPSIQSAIQISRRPGPDRVSRRPGNFGSLCIAADRRPPGQLPRI